MWPVEEGYLQGVSEGLASGCLVVQLGQAFTKRTAETQITPWQGPAVCRKCSLAGLKGRCGGGENQGLRLCVSPTDHSRTPSQQNPESQLGLKVSPAHPEIQSITANASLTVGCRCKDAKPDLSTPRTMPRVSSRVPWGKDSQTTLTCYNHVVL